MDEGRGGKGLENGMERCDCLLYLASILPFTALGNAYLIGFSLFVAPELGSI